MNTLLAAGMLTLMAQGPAPESPTRPITLNFSDTDVAQIFRVIGLRTGTNIIYSGTEKLMVSLSYTANTTEEAVRSVSTAAGLSYRRVGVKTYVAAKPEALKKALSPYTRRARLASPGLMDAEAYFTKTLPDLTVLSATPRNIEVSGIQADIDSAQEILERLSRDADIAREEEAKLGPIVTDVVSLNLADASGIAQVVGQIWPTIKVIPITAAGAGGAG
ncbi:hypothetical protein EON81_26980, partial [bacterium]